MQELCTFAANSVDIQLYVLGSQQSASGSVVFENEAQAESAISSIDGKELGGSSINVSSKGITGGDEATPARAREAGRSRGRGRSSFRGRRGRGRGPRGRVDLGEEGAQVENQEAQVPETQGQATAEPAAESTASAVDESNKDAPASAEVGEKENAPDATQAPAAQSQDTPARRPKGPKRERRVPQGVPNDTLVFMSGLAPSVDDATIMEFLAPYAPKSAHVVRMRFRPHRSKGFAFVDFENNEMQQKVIQEMYGKELNGRKVGLKGAFLLTSCHSA